MARICFVLVIGVLGALGCGGSDELCESVSDCNDGFVCATGTCVEDDISVSGDVEGESPSFVDARFEPDDTCGASGVYIGTSSNSLETCADPLSVHLSKPYVQIYLSGDTPGVYTHSDESTCDTGGNRFFASFDGETTGTDESVSGSVTITQSDGDTVLGDYEIEFRVGTDGANAGSLVGSFSVGSCQ